VAGRVQNSFPYQNHQPPTPTTARVKLHRAPRATREVGPPLSVSIPTNSSRIPTVKLDIAKARKVPDKIRERRSRAPGVGLRAIDRRAALWLLAAIATTAIVVTIALATTWPASPPPSGPSASRPAAGRPPPDRRAPRARMAGQPRFPIRAAFYYAWYPQTWTVGGRYPHFHPTASYYSSARVATQRAQIHALVYAGMDAAISSWKQPGSSLDRRLRGLLAATVRTGAPLKWAVYYENEGRANPTAADIARDLSYIRHRLATSRAYLRVRRRFVVFVYNADDRSCGVVHRWRAANARLGRPAYLVLKVFPGYRECHFKPDAWHQYAPAHATGQQGNDAYEISPGFWKANEPTPRLRRSVRRFRRGIRAMIRSRSRWQLVTTFNEWGEGTAVESGREWATPSGEGAYLDALHAAHGR
jgi:hypothetical protein